MSKQPKPEQQLLTDLRNAATRLLNALDTMDVNSNSLERYGNSTAGLADLIHAWCDTIPGTPDTGLPGIKDGTRD